MDKILQNIGSATDPVAKGLINIQQKTRIVEDIFEQLKPIDPTSVKNAEYQKMVGVLRSLCREKTGSECFFVAENVNILVRHCCFYARNAIKLSTPVAADAMRCLANIQSMHEPARKWFTRHADACILPEIVHLLLQSKNIENSTLFPVLRNVFFASAVDQNLATGYLNAGMLDSLAEILERLENGELGSERSYDGILKTEILNITFNITISKQKSQFMKITDIAEEDESNLKFKRMLVGLIKLGTKSSFTLPGISPPHGQIINALLNFPFEPFVDLWFPENSTAYLDTLSSIFEGLMLHLVPLGQEPLEETVFGGSIDELIIPIVLVLTKMAGHPLAQTIMKAKFMPNDIDRTKPLVELASVTGALVRSMSSIRLHQTKDLICELLVKILKGDLEYFIAYFGFSNCAGYLFNQGVTQPIHTGKVLKGIPDNLDIVTGMIKKDEPNLQDDMTEEEKEMEAQKLFEMIDRLNKNGIIKVVPK